MIFYFLRQTFYGLKHDGESHCVSCTDIFLTLEIEVIMKKFVQCLAVAATMIVVMCSCSDGKTTVTNANGETQEVQAEALKSLDYQGIVNLMNENKTQLTEDDVDFLLDQMEIVVEKTEGMTKDDYKAYLNNLTEDEQGALLVLGLGLAGAEQQGTFTDSQKKRFEELEARSPAK